VICQQFSFWNQARKLLTFGGRFLGFQTENTPHQAQISPKTYNSFNQSAKPPMVAWEDQSYPPIPINLMPQGNISEWGIALAQVRHRDMWNRANLYTITSRTVIL
jgi:hypothetical protein